MGIDWRLEPAVVFFNSCRSWNIYKTAKLEPLEPIVRCALIKNAARWIA